jgi:hypothetical protein
LFFAGGAANWKTEFPLIALYGTHTTAEVVRNIFPAAEDFRLHDFLSSDPLNLGLRVYSPKAGYQIIGGKKLQKSNKRWEHKVLSGVLSTDSRIRLFQRRHSPEREPSTLLLLQLAHQCKLGGRSANCGHPVSNRKQLALDSRTFLPLAREQRFQSVRTAAAFLFVNECESVTRACDAFALPLQARLSARFLNLKVDRMRDALFPTSLSLSKHRRQGLVWNLC